MVRSSKTWVGAIPQFAHLAAQAAGRIGHHGFGGVRKQRQVGRPVSDIGESGFAELTLQAGELSASGQVGCAIAAENAVENREMTGDSFRKDAGLRRWVR